MRDLLFEIGTEELPAKHLPGIIDQLEDLAVKGIRESRLGYRSITVKATPRRLVLYVEGLAEVQEDLRTKVRGPSVEVAYDDRGQPTRAALGFARGQGVDPSELIAEDTDSGRYVFAERREKGRKASDVLPGLLPNLVTSLTFPVSMRWADKELRFLRPVRWFCALLGDELIPFEVDGIESSRYTFGLRFETPLRFEVSDAGSYEGLLLSRGIIVDHNRRREEIARQVAELTESCGGRADSDESLLEEVTFLVEKPTAFLGSFPGEYLELPQEVPVTSMKSHQRYFPVFDKEGALMPRFIGVRNGGPEYIDIVRAGNEKVLKARLSDAVFFFEEDRKRPLNDRLEDLKGIVFHASLGSLYNKTQRVRVLAGRLAGELNLGEDERADLERAALLMKTDLTTNMVGEFPELQGVMGREYALLDGEKPAVARAIFEHYLPRFSGDAIAASLPGRLLSMADKLDTLAGFFLVGQEPTGSQDPYGLRRAALGVLRTMVEGRMPLSLQASLEMAFEGYGDLETDSDPGKASAAAREFLRSRLRVWLVDRGFRREAVLSVTEGPLSRIDLIEDRCRAIEDFMVGEEYQVAASAFRRASNLALKAPGREVDPSLFVEPEERQLYEAVVRFDQKESWLGEGKYREYLSALADLKEPVDSFMDRILVMDEDRSIRDNRLAILKRVVEVFDRAAGFSQLPPV